MGCIQKLDFLRWLAVATLGVWRRTWGSRRERPMFLLFVEDGLLLVDDAGVERLCCGG